MDFSISTFKSGVQNLLPTEEVAQDAAQDSLGFITKDARIVLIPGRVLVGSEGSVGLIRGEWFGYKVDGSQVHYRKTETTVQYLKAGVWTNILTGLTSGTEASFANYSSLAGAFTFINCVDGYWKINNAFPENPLQMYDSAKNFHGRIFINAGRTILYRRQDAKSKDFTGVYGSRIDPQNATNYTTVTGEATASLGGTLAFVAANRNAFGIAITLTGTGEVYTDNFMGVLTGSLGGTGTINYITGAYTISNAGVGTASYQWENSNVLGLTDFTKSATRLAGEGFQLPQDQGGDPIMLILIGQDGAYYSLKQNSTWRFDLNADPANPDLHPDNNIFYLNMGVPSQNAGIATGKGIVFLNTANPTKPELTILQKNPVGDNILPIVLFPNFKFANYNYDDCYFQTFERFILASCKQLGSTNNDRILALNVSDGTVDILPYPARMIASDKDENLFVGSPYTQSSYQIFSGYDDDGQVINAYWKSKTEKYYIPGMRQARWRFIQEILKKFRKSRIKGRIDPNQWVELWGNFDDSGWQLLGTIRGDATYVDTSSPQTIGSNYIGTSLIGGDKLATIYPYFAEIKVKVPKFRKRSLQFIPKGFGYFDCEFLSDWDLMLFEDRLPSRLRQKQKVSLDGKLTNQ